MKFIHLSEQHEEKEIQVRKHLAFESWMQIASISQEQYHVLRYNSSDYFRKAFERDLPYLKDILTYGLNYAQPDDVIVLTNDDTFLRTEVYYEIKNHLKRFRFGCSFRADVQSIATAPKPPMSFPVPNNTGHDLFFFRADFLKSHMEEIPDFVMGAWKWDLVLALLMRKWAGIRVDNDTTHANSSIELIFGYVLHEAHQAYWSMRQNLYTLPSQKYNESLYDKWLLENAPELIKVRP